MPHPLSNRLLEALPPEERIALEKHLREVALPVGTVLFEAGRLPGSIYLITSGAASVVAFMQNGEAVEVGLTGREGIPGSVLLLGSQRGATRCFMQVEGTGLRMDFCIFQEQLFKHPILHRRVLQHVQHDALTLSQLSACNRLHEVEERLARWLLMVSDRIGSSELAITQEFLSEMLGSRRSTVTVVAGSLQRSGLIEYRRGHVQILNRHGLEKVACECYPVTRRLYDGLYQDAHAAVH